MSPMTHRATEGVIDHARGSQEPVLYVGAAGDWGRVDAPSPPLIRLGTGHRRPAGRRDQHNIRSTRSATGGRATFRFQEGEPV